MMKRNLAAIVICLISGLMLAGCKGNSTDNKDAVKDKPTEIAEAATEEKETEPSEEKTEEKTEEKGTEETNSEPTETAESDDPEKLYEPVFSEAYEVIDYGYNFDKEYEYVSGGFTEKVMYSEGVDLLKDIGYYLEDMSGDGIP